MEVEPPSHVRNGATITPALVVRVQFHPSDPLLERSGDITAHVLLFNHPSAPNDTHVQGFGIQRGDHPDPSPTGNNYMDFIFPTIQVSQNGTFHFLMSIRFFDINSDSDDDHTLVIGDIDTSSFTVA